jgi:hypothetical protein
MTEDNERGPPTTLKQGDTRLLDTAIAKDLLISRLPARFAFTAKDGTPRVIPTWFHWTGEELVMPTFVAAPHVQREASRIAALRERPDVAITIDTEGFPPHVLLIRGKASVEVVDGVPAEYAESARKYLGEEEAAGYLVSVDQPGTRMARIAVRPAWVGVLDFETRMPGPMAG